MHNLYILLDVGDVLIYNVSRCSLIFVFISLSKNIIGDRGLSMIMNALIAKPLSSLKMLGYVIT